MRLKNEFAHLSKWWGDCDESDCKGVAITIFDHWLYQTNTQDKLCSASQDQQKKWYAQVDAFLAKLCETDPPIFYRRIGRRSKSSLQFRRIFSMDTLKYIQEEIRKECWNHPDIVFQKSGVSICYSEDWTLFVRYKKVQNLDQVILSAAENNLYLLSHERGVPCKYEEIAEKLDEMGLNKCRQREVA